MSQEIQSFLNKPGFEFIKKEDGWEVYRVRDVPDHVKVILSVRDTDTNEQKVGVTFINKDKVLAKDVKEYYEKLQKVMHLRLEAVR